MTLHISFRMASFFAASLLLASCAGHPALMPQSLTGLSERNALGPATAGQHLLLIGESGSSGGVIELFRAPFNGSPQLLHVDAPVGETIAPNGDLIVADLYHGIWVFDPPFKRKRLLFRGEQFNGQFIYDSKERLIVPTRGSAIVVFAPPYTKKPVATIVVPAPIDQVAIDAHDNVFVGTQRTISGGAPTYECKPPRYYTCIDLKIGNGAAAIDSSGDLLTGVSSNELAVFPPPYTNPKAKAKVPFGFNWLTAAHSGDTFVAGIDGSGINYFGLFPSSIKERFKRLPIEQYFIPYSEYSIAKNRDLFISEGKYENQRLCVNIYPYPYSRQSGRCIRPMYPIWSIFAI